MGSRPQLLAFAAGFLVASLLAAAFVLAPRGGVERFACLAAAGGTRI